jgi:hypothetical protein
MQTKEAERRIDVKPWHHGLSSNVECEDGCSTLMEGAPYALALATAKHHAKRTGHVVNIEQTRFREVVPE